MSTVKIGCKLPAGIILELGINPATGVRSDKYKAVKLNGANSSRLVGGFGMTDVDEAFWTEWSTTNANLAWMRNGTVFVQAANDKEGSEAKGRVKVKSGFERLTPKDMPKGMTEDLPAGLTRYDRTG